MTKGNKSNSLKLVTLAIRSLEHAKSIAHKLAKSEIEVTFHPINDKSSDQNLVRIRINEKDLLKALQIIEQEEIYMKNEHQTDDYVLIPVDFSDYSKAICRFGIYFAARRGLKVILFHAYSSQLFVPPVIWADSIAIQTSTNENTHYELNRATLEMNNLKVYIEELMLEEELPRVPYRSVLRYGMPDDAILSYSKRHPPIVIVMGTRGKSQCDSDLIGSVAAEVIDSSQVPVFVIPSNVPFDDFANAKNVAIATNFEERDIFLFDQYCKLAINHINPNYIIFNTSTFSSDWTSIQLKAIENYFQEKYPLMNAKYVMLEAGEFNISLEKFLKENSIDIIVVNTYRRNFFTKLLHPSAARRLLFYSGMPLLVMHA